MKFSPISSRWQFRIKSEILLILGCVFSTLIAWRWHMPFAAWIAPICLLRFIRTQPTFKSTLLAYPALMIAALVNKHGGWDLELGLELALVALIPIIILIPLYLDRFVTQKYTTSLTTLVYPVSLVTLEFILGYTPLGTLFSLGATQLEYTSLIQLSSIFGMWGISFLIGWTAAIVNRFWQHLMDDLKISSIYTIFAGIFIGFLLFGSIRTAFIDPSASVRIAGVSTFHPRNYWGEIIDQNTPSEDVSTYIPEFAVIEDQLFESSERAALAGAKIIFWSEGACPYYQDYELSFLNRSQVFAQTYNVYFAPSVLKLLYGTTLSENKVIMFAPNGTIMYEYIKTISWYETPSDGIIDYVDTPYGRLASTICFDNDLPAFVHQAGKNHVDILLVPAFDSVVIKKFHGQTAAFRGVENGMSVFRMAAEGISYATDYLGNIIGVQDYFDTTDHLLVCDLPKQGVKTIYGVIGDGFVYANLVIMGLISIECVGLLFIRKSLFKLRTM